MLKFRPSNITKRRANISFNEVQLIALIEKALSDNSLRGYLFKRSSSNAKWRLKWFLLFENLLFYFDVGDRPTALANKSHPTTHWNHAHVAPSRPVQASCPQAAATTASATSAAAISAEQSAPKSPSKALSSLVRRAGGQKQQQQSNRCEDNNKKAQRRAPEVVQQQQQQQTNKNEAPEPSAEAADSDGVADSVEQSENKSSKSKSGQQPGIEVKCNLHEVQRASLPLTTMSLGTHCCNVVVPQPDSSSISGVSSHFLAHNEQTIGRSTTTSAGRTPAQVSANYESLLSRKIGVIFLEGSYCERLIDGGANVVTSGPGVDVDHCCSTSDRLVTNLLVSPSCNQQQAQVATCATAPQHPIGATNCSCHSHHQQQAPAGAGSATNACPGPAGLLPPSAPPSTGFKTNANGDVSLLLRQQQPAAASTLTSNATGGSVAKGGGGAIASAANSNTIAQPNDQDEYESEVSDCGRIYQVGREGERGDEDIYGVSCTD